MHSVWLFTWPIWSSDHRVTFGVRLGGENEATVTAGMVYKRECACVD